VIWGILINTEAVGALRVRFSAPDESVIELVTLNDERDTGTEGL
jgi:hypothetical protein